MTTGQPITRRRFLQTGACAGAGLVIAFRLPASAAEGGAAGLAPNAWLRLDRQGEVTVIVARSEMGQGVRTVLPMLVAEELEADWRRVRFEQAIPEPKYGDMSTGGSMSVRSLHETLRQAGAAAREMLLAAAAGAWGVDRSECRAERGEVIHRPSGRRLAYGELAERAASLPVPQDPPLKPPQEWRILGTSPPRLDSPAKVQGSAEFGIDVRLPGMLFAVVARCPVFGGRAAGFQAARALAVAGVKQVTAISSGVAVIADSSWAAIRGREALEVRWEEGRLAALDSAAVSRGLAEAAQRQDGAAVRKEGAGAAALAGAARTLEAVYETPYLAHATLEPMNCTAHVTAGRCEVWVPTQSASGAQEAAAEITGLPPEKVIVHTTYLGGGFGRRAEQDFLAEAVEASQAAGAPVQVLWTREDDMGHDFYRPATLHLLRAGLDAAGAPLAWTHRMVGPSILARVAPRAVRDGLDPTSVDGAYNLPYAFPHLEIDYVLHDPGVPVGWWRSVSCTQNTYAMECFLDEVAAAGGVDPLELRRRLLGGHPRHLGVLELAATKAGWGSPLPPGRGRGLALQESFGSFVAQVAEVEVAADGAARVRRVTCAVDCGHCLNPDTVRAQMEGAIVFGLSAALYGEITIQQGRVAQENFTDYPILTLEECPEIEVHIVPSGEPVGGIGEPGVPPVAPAVVNALAAATGRRLRRLPVRPQELRRS